MKPKKKIVFAPSEEIFEVLETQPQPAARHIPEWFKKLSLFIDDTARQHRTNNGYNLTVKACVPFLDGLTAGYMVVLPCDVWVSNNPNSFKFQWDVSWTVIKEHYPLQIAGMDIPLGCDPTAYKFEGTFSIKTPPGYSLLVVHPLNRHDLPFVTLSAIVDSDRYDFYPINLPFFIKSDFEGILKKGTPIAQVIPLKRDSWTHQTEKYSSKARHGLDIIKSTIFRSYKSRFWERKTYN